MILDQIMLLMMEKILIVLVLVYIFLKNDVIQTSQFPNH